MAGGFFTTEPPGEPEGHLDSGFPAAPICLLQVNGQKVTAPYEPVDQLRVSLRSDRLFVITDFELVVSFNGKNNAGA